MTTNVVICLWNPTAGIVTFNVTAPGKPADKVSFLGAGQYSFAVGGVANLRFPPVLDATSVRQDQSLIWITGMPPGLTVPVEGGSTLFADLLNCVIQLIFQVETAE